MNDPRGYYAQLGLSPSATSQDIKRAYRTLAKRYHPDLNSDAAAAREFRKITEAYETLSDLIKRAAYDGPSRSTTGHASDKRSSQKEAPPGEPSKPEKPDVQGKRRRNGLGVVTIFLIVFAVLLVGAGGAGFWAVNQGYVDLASMFSSQPATEATAPAATVPVVADVAAPATGPGNTATPVETAVATTELKAEERLTPEPALTGAEPLALAPTGEAGKTEERLGAAPNGEPAANAETALKDGIAAYKRGDYGNAIRLLTPYAERGNAKALTAVGLMYASGLGIPQNFAEAFKWLRQAAEQGEAGAQGALGVMYRSGQGIPRDYAEALLWSRKAAEQGNPAAQNDLGFMYNAGLGVPQDYVQAHMWYNLSASQGYAVAAKNRDNVAARMTLDQVAEAQRLAREWLAAHPSPGQIAVDPTTERGGDENLPTDYTPIAETAETFTVAAYVQLSSQLSESEAKASFRNAQWRWSGLFQGNQLEIQRADLGQKGVYYRVRLPTHSLQEATQICASIRVNGGDCFATNG